MKRKYQVVVVGGGLGGLTTALHLTKRNIDCLLIEKSTYPSHKVCGEYVSNEVLTYLNYLEIDPTMLGAKSISKYLISTKTGKTVKGNLQLGGFGISRYSLDNLLYNQLLRIGGQIVFDQVISLKFNEDLFLVDTIGGVQLEASFVIGAFGKRSNLDKALNRSFIQKKSHWLAVKAHYQFDFEDDLVALHNFDGGYCGLSKVESDAVNTCYLTTYASFKKAGNIEKFQQKIMAKNPYLNSFFNNAKLLFEEPLTISQVSFEKKRVVENHILMAGDTAGLVHPLCGNGMAMAIHAAKLCSELLIRFFNREISNRVQLEEMYKKQWDFHFAKRLKTGRVLSKVFLSDQLSNMVMKSGQIFPGLIPQIINKTHGKPITLETVS